MTGVKNVPILYLEFNIKKMSFTKIPKFKITYRVVFWHFQLDPKMVNLVINIFIIFIAEIFFIEMQRQFSTQSTQCAGQNMCSEFL